MNKHITTDNLKTIFPPIEYLINQKAENLDWNENDPNSKGYIKNRPFYTYEKVIEGKYLVQETTFTGIIQDGAPIYVAELSCDYDVIDEVAATPEDWMSTTFNVLYDGVTYQASGKIFEGNGMPYIGNLYAFVGDESANTGEPFTFIIEGAVAVFDGNEHTISIQLPDSYETTDVKIDAKYLPEVGLGRKGVGENAEVYNGGSPTQAIGEWSHVEGLDNIASGQCSHAEGHATRAQGGESHAEGEGTEASGLYSHAEGQSTVASGQASHAEGYNTKATGDYSHAEGSNSTASGDMSHAEGNETVASGDYSHAEGRNTTASGIRSHSEGYNTVASQSSAHAEGISTQAIGTASHAEGNNVVAAGGYSHAEGGYTRTGSDQTLHATTTTSIMNSYQHAEGYATLAKGVASHAEGQCTTASGRSSHAEGENTVAYAQASHAEGTRTTANSKSQHVQGEYNILDIAPENPYLRGKYAHIVGNGYITSDAIIRSNAHTLDWNGNAWFAGNVYTGGTGQDDASVEKLVTTTELYQAKDHIAFVDQVNGNTYIVSMRNGSLISRTYVTSIEVTTMPIKTTYATGEAFDPTGMVVVGTMQDGGTLEVANYIYPTIITKDMTSVEISYMEAGKTCTTTVPITLIDLTDFEYTANEDGTYTLTDWKQTLNGEPSAELVVPDSELIII